MSTSKEDSNVHLLREPPHSVEAEHSVLGALLMDSSCFASVAEVITGASFFDHANKLIFSAIERLCVDRLAADVVSVFEWLHCRVDNDTIFGGLAYLNALVQGVPSARNARRHAEIVRDHAIRRDLIAAADKVRAAVYESPTAAIAVERVQSLIGEAVTTSGYVEPAKARTLDLRQLAQCKAPARHWFIPAWLHDGPMLFAASGGIGKTLLAQQVATAGALGRDLVGNIEQPFRSLLWACEDDADELWRRQEVISEHMGITLDAPAANLVIQSRVGVENLLMAGVFGEMRLTAVYELLRQQVNDLGIDVLWADNLAHLFGGDENNRAQVTGFINALSGLVVGRPFAVALLAHTARYLGSEFAGSAAWENACRMRWYLGTKLPDAKPTEGQDDDDDDDVRYLAKRKANYTTRDYVRFTMADGVLVPDQTASYTTGLMVHLDKAKAESVVLAAFHKLREMGIASTDSKNSGDFLPKMATEKGLGEGYTKEQLKQAMDRLMTAGTFARGEIGKYVNRNPRLGLVLVGEALI